jgi:hypothetical protein
MKNTVMEMNTSGLSSYAFSASLTAASNTIFHFRRRPAPMEIVAKVSCLLSKPTKQETTLSLKNHKSSKNKRRVLPLLPPSYP